jgi:small subunit ribosomal protein S1
VNERSYRRTEHTPTIDEAWWAALLAEEERLGKPSHLHSVNEQIAENKLKGTVSQTKQANVDWVHAQNLYEMDETVTLEVTSFNRGGLLVDGDDLHGFVPISHLVDTSGEIPEEERDQELKQYLGRQLSLKVIECDPERGRVVFSERAALAHSGRRNQLLEELAAGDCIDGIVTNITDFGVFVDLGGIEGLVHVSEISWGRVRHPSDAVQIGEKVRAYVIQIDKDRTRIALSLKRLCNNPWETAESRYHPGQVVEAQITSLVPFGAFARLEEGLDGLIHISELGLQSERLRPSDVLKEGQSVMVRVLHVNAARQRLGLSLAEEPNELS